MCCPPERAQAALATLFAREGLDEKASATAAAVVFANFDLAPAGSLLVLKEHISRLARGENYKG